jgi:TolA-binding protein
MQQAALVGLLALCCTPAAMAQDGQVGHGSAACPTGQVCTTLSPVEVFDLAARLAAENETDRAEVLLRSLADNPEPEVRAEARFRLGNLLLDRGEYTEAARSYQALIDEQPDATPVRLQLARALALMGREDAARAQLRRASSASWN